MSIKVCKNDFLHNDEDCDTLLDESFDDLDEGLELNKAIQISQKINKELEE